MDRPVRGINLAIMLRQTHVFFVLPIVFEWGTREENIFVILVVSWWFWSSFDSISISFGNIEKKYPRMCSGLPGIVQSSMVRSCTISTPFFFNIREASRRNVGMSCK